MNALHSSAVDEPSPSAPPTELPTSPDAADVDSSSASRPTGATNSSVVSLRMLLNDAAVYGLASVADRAIGFLLLPLVTALMNPADYGIVSLFTTSAHLAFVVSSLCIHQAFFRHYTEATDEARRQRLIDVSITLALLAWLVFAACSLTFGESLNHMLFGLSGSALVDVLAAVTIMETFDALAGNRLQADGRPWALFWIRIGGSLVMRAMSVAAILLGAGAWGWIVSDAVCRMLSSVLIVAVAFPRIKLRWDPRLMRTLGSYGAMLIPAMLSFYAMTVADKYAIRGLCDHPLEQVGFYSVGERIAGIMHIVNLAFILGWQRFAFRNMHLPDGPRIIARGMLVFAIGGGLLATALSLLGDDLTHWLIAAKFAPGIPVILPLTIAAYLGGLASAAETGLHKVMKPGVISYLNVAAAALNLALNFLAIPRWGIAGAAYATLISQAVRLIAIAVVSQREFPLPMDYRRLFLAWGTLAAVLATGQLFRPLGWTAATIGQSALIAATPLLLWFLPLMTYDERLAAKRALAKLAALHSWKSASAQRIPPSADSIAEMNEDPSLQTVAATPLGDPGAT